MAAVSARLAAPIPTPFIDFLVSNGPFLFGASHYRELDAHPAMRAPRMPQVFGSRALTFAITLPLFAHRLRRPLRQPA